MLAKVSGAAFFRIVCLSKNALKPRLELFTQAGRNVKQWPNPEVFKACVDPVLEVVDLVRVDIAFPGVNLEAELIVLFDEASQVATKMVGKSVVSRQPAYLEDWIVIDFMERGFVLKQRLASTIRESGREDLIQKLNQHISREELEL